MRKLKKLSLLLVGLILVFSLVACNSNVDKPDTDIIETPEDGAVNEDIEDPLEDILEGDEKDPMDDLDNTDAMDGIIQSSDYISKIKVVTTNADKKEIEVVDNIKKELSPEDLPEIAELEDNKMYLVFMKDQDNSVVLTDELESVILLENENKDLYEKINEQVNTQ